MINNIYANVLMFIESHSERVLRIPQRKCCMLCKCGAYSFVVFVPDSSSEMSAKKSWSRILQIRFNTVVSMLSLPNMR